MMATYLANIGHIKMTDETEKTYDKVYSIEIEGGPIGLIKGALGKVTIGIATLAIRLMYLIAFMVISSIIGIAIILYVGNQTFDKTPLQRECIEHATIDGRAECVLYKVD